ncbi:uncharacterized protein LOC112043317 [Bicyclus anynana]|uniref:Uncharacterized protein LOC112043317 n=1 Tax=Bicyclus anynana TaxID=110368 RepID=A0A6J1MNE2_BICAN|nr:uncharacterized protein LOC112043317 [Bicyclus anynana]XP_023934428.2 uncharacterized protein LOC112043317 [Bicyclus anynana]XP_052737307.1 uncharacterized protein LOC112043317 [Bicyclus anynana]XP_052737308.1 uncharacterized protein LOC112043317 [Bicyclus anynana]
MNMIEVDPKLFVKCRLCLDETGQYQIVPNVQMQIKYCFDIDVEPFDGLPQLVCKKCESILSQHAGIKQMFQEKQKNLKSKLNANANIDNIIQQQQDTVSSTQADTENKNKLEEIKFNKKIVIIKKSSASTRRISTESETSNHSQKKKNKNTKKAWQSAYTKYFICRFCSKSFKDLKGINSHIKKQCKLYKKYSNINKSYCLVHLNKIKSHTSPQSNITGSTENVVCSKNKIIQSSRPNFYVLYTDKSQINVRYESSESSDEDFFTDKKKRKRRRQISSSSNETVVVDQNIAKKSDHVKQAKVKKPKKDENKDMISDIECVNIEDSDSNSTKSSVKTKDDLLPEKTNTINDTMVNRIIGTCFSKYMNRLNASEGDNTSKDKVDSSLKHKVLSIGRKVINKNGLNTTGLLRYMEHKNLEVVWVSTIDTKVLIKTRIKESGDNDNTHFGWENISLPTHNHITKDFSNDFERISALESSVNECEEEQLNQANLQCEKITEKEQVGSNAIHLENSKEADTQNIGNNSNNDPVPNKVSSEVGKVEKKVGDNPYLRAVLDAEKSFYTKLLNANPVANPKQLPKKNTFNEPASIVKLYSNEMQKESEVPEESNVEKSNDMLHMPIITSTVSLAPIDNQHEINEQANIESSNQSANELNNYISTIAPQPQSSMPKIKVKPVSELMSERALSQQNNTFVSTAGWISDASQNDVLQSNSSNMLFIASQPFTNVIPVQQDLLYYPQNQVNNLGLYNSALINKSASKSQCQEYVKLHTVELPNTKTNSPFRYLQKLLQIHKIHLMDSEDVLSPAMKCLMKFKVVFEQESNSPVKLSLHLFCGSNVFCIKVKDDDMKQLDLTQFSANWQWEILKVFRGDDIVPKLKANALKLGKEIHAYVNYFTSLLRSIVYSKES